MLNGHLKEVTVFGLEQEEESTLRLEMSRVNELETTGQADLHLVHDSRSDDDALVSIL